MLEWFMSELAMQSQSHFRPANMRIGDQGLAYHWRVFGDDFSMVVWRFRRFFAVVAADGTTKAWVLALARTQQGRIARA